MIRSHSEKLLQKWHLHVSCAVSCELEIKEEMNFEKKSAWRLNVQNCLTDHAAAQEYMWQLTRSHSADNTDSTAKAGRCCKSKKHSTYRVVVKI